MAVCLNIMCLTVAVCMLSRLLQPVSIIERSDGYADSSSVSIKRQLKIRSHSSAYNESTSWLKPIMKVWDIVISSIYATTKLFFAMILTDQSLHILQYAIWALSRQIPIEMLRARVAPGRCSPITDGRLNSILRIKTSSAFHIQFHASTSPECVKIPLMDDAGVEIQW